LMVSCATAAVANDAAIAATETSLVSIFIILSSPSSPVPDNEYGRHSRNIPALWRARLATTQATALQSGLGKKTWLCMSRQHRKCRPSLNPDDGFENVYNTHRARAPPHRVSACGGQRQAQFQRSSNGVRKICSSLVARPSPPLPSCGWAPKCTSTLTPWRYMSLL
jgi:hypothetical protein